MQMELHQTRELTVQIPQVENQEDNRQVQISFSSEQPVQRYINGQYYNEVLSHAPGAVVLDRLLDKAALLYNHNYDDILGVVESARIDSDLIGRAVVRFSTVGSGAEKYELLKQGILTKVSVGYEIHEYEIQGDTLLVTSWTPLELSMVSVPADTNCAVGRSLNKNTVSSDEDETVLNKEEEQSQGDDDESNTDSDEADTDGESTEPQSEPDNQSEESTEEDTDSTEEEINKEEQEQKRIAELLAIGRALAVPVDSAISQGMTIEEFKRNLNKPITIKEDKMEKLTELLRSIQNGSVDAVKASQGYKIDSGDLVRGFNASRAGVTTTSAAPITQTTVLYNSFVDALYGESVLKNFPNIQRYTGLTSNISIPKLGADFTKSFGFVGENGDSPEVDPQFTSILMKPQSFSGSVPLSRQVLTTCPQVESIVSNALVAGSAQRLEQLILKEVVAQAVAAGHVKEVDAFTYEDLVALQGEIADEGVPFGQIAAVMSPGVKATLRTTLRGTNTAAVYLLDDGMCAGVPAFDSKVLAGEQFIILGDFGNLAIGEWAAMSVDYDDTTYRSKGASVVRLWADIAFALTRPEAFRVLRIKP